MPPVAVLLTGVGYIGSALVPRLLAAGERVVGLESFYCSPAPDVRELMRADGLQLVEGDVANPADVTRAFGAALALGGPLTVYHLAAQPSAAIAARDPATTERTNLVGSRLVLQAACDYGATLVFAGSFRVYGDDLPAVVDEDTPYGRVTDLSHLSKVYVEQLGRMLGGAFVSVRLGVTYGLSPITKTDPPFMTVPNLFCQRALQGEVLRVLEDRPMAFIHVEDAADALIAAGRLAADGGWRAVNAAPEVRTIGRVAQSVQRAAAERGLAVEVQGAALHSRASFTVRSSLHAVGWQPLRQMDTALLALFEAFRANPV